MQVDIHKVALVNNPYSEALELAETIRAVWCATFEMPPSAVWILNVDEPLSKFLDSYSSNYTASTETAFRELRSDLLKDYQRHKILHDIQTFHINSLQNNIHDQVLIIFFNVNAPDAVNVLRQNQFRLYKVLNEQQGDIIHGHYPNIKDMELQSLKGTDIDLDATVINITGRKSIKQEAIKVIQSLL
jgi:hypothetical protein